METVAKIQPKMALDYLEPGQGDELFSAENQKVTKTLPEGVTSKMLYRDVVRIAWPSFIELTLTQLTSMVDMMMVGQLGAAAITAVGLTTQPKFLLMTLIMSLNVGATAMVARHKGAGDQQKANLILRQALLMTLVFSLMSSILGFAFSKPLVQFMGASDAASLEGGTIYLQIQMLGFVFMGLTSTVTATLRGVGDSRTAMIYNLTANLMNVVFNYLLIYGHFGFPQMGVAGASLATVIGQTVAFVYAFFYIMRGNRYLHLRLRDGFKPDRQAMTNIIEIGIPAMIEQLVMRTGIIIYSKTVASLGTVAFATHQICMNIQALSFMNGQAFAVSATSLMGQSLGKRRPDMAQAYTRRTRRIGMMFSFLIAFVCFFFGGTLVSFYNNDPEIVAQGAKILMFVALIQPLQSSQFILAGALRGAGDTKSIARVTFITVLLVRPGLAILLINLMHWGLEGAWVALVADQLLRSILVLLRYNSGKWKSLRLSGEER